ncbi:endonuclease/exonuclease/phosphatase family protein [Candidatus Latescibacterota bacterium]
MQEESFSANGSLKTVVISILLWIYAGLAVYTWFFARMSPDKVVLVRIASSFFSDLVWIPLGIIVWTIILKWITHILLKYLQKCGFFLLNCGLTLTAAFFVIVFPETAFRFLFLPLTVFGVMIFIQILRANNQPLKFIIFIPAVIIVSVTIIHYKGQLLPSISPGKNVQNIKVMTYNIYGEADTLRRLEMIETIRRERPDVVCCTEYNRLTDPEIFERYLSALYPYVAPEKDERWWGTGEIILSRYPITLRRNVTIPDNENGFSEFVFAEIVVGGKKLNIINMHLTATGHSIENAAESSLELKEKMSAVSQFEHIKDKQKYFEARSFLNYCANFSDPAILCGDLNDTPNSRVYHMFAKQYRNTFSLKGWGLGGTFGESWIKERIGKNLLSRVLAWDFIRIDHIFVSSHFDVLSSRVVTDAGGSDHKPVIAVVRLKEE